MKNKGAKIEIVEYLRNKLKMTQEKAGELVGIVQQRVDQIENGSNANIRNTSPSDLTLNVLCKVRLEYLYCFLMKGIDLFFLLFFLTFSCSIAK